MDSENRYSFRKRDYAKIKDWYTAAQSSYFPEDKIKDEKAKIWHYKIQMEEIELTQQYVNNGLKNLNAIKEIVIFTSIFQRNQRCSVSQCKQIRRYCDFKFSNSRISFSEDITLYFYLQDSTPKLYELRLEIQIITKDGIILKLGSVNHNLSQETISQVIFPIHGRFNPKWKVEQEKKYEKDVDQGPQPLGKIDVHMEYEEIKQISKLLPAFVIIDQNSKIPPCSTFSLRKKKEQIVLDQPYKLGMQNLLFHITNPALLREELMANNPFTMSHKEVVQCSIKQYSITLDMHNGWKFLNHGKNSIVLQQVLQNEAEIYLSSKSTQKLSLSYYDSEGIVFLILLRVKAEFRVKQIGKCKSEQFLLGWLPIPLDLSLKENKLDMLLVCNQSFPAMEIQQINIPTNVSAIITHPLYTKYKARQDDRKTIMSSLPLQLNDFNQPQKYLGPHSKKRVTQILSSKQIKQKQVQVQEEIESLKKIIQQHQKEKLLQRFINVIGKAGLGQQKINIATILDTERIVGRFLKLRVELKSLIPQTETPSSYYLPKKLQATLYVLRNIFHLNCSINENNLKYHIPISLNCNKSSINVRILVDSLRQFEELSNSRLVLVLNQEGNMLPYARGHLSLSQLVGEQKDEKVSYLRLYVWQEEKEKCFGTILSNSYYELENIKVNHTKVEEVKLQKEIQKLSMEQRLKLRIGNYKGDNEPKNKVVNILKQKKHLEYISSVVEGQLLCDGEISYEIGFDSHFLFCFTNEQKSQNNIFTFHIDCPYAQLITQQDQYRKTMIQMNVEFQNYKYLQYVLKQKISESYYQTNLAFNQAIGLLLRLNVNEIKQGGLKKIELIVKRNTFQVRRFILKCNYKQPLIWDAMEAFEIMQPEQQQARIPLPQYLAVNYRDFQVLNANIKYDFRNKEIVFLRRGMPINEVYLTVSPIQDKKKRVIILKSHFLRGKEISITAGQKISTSIESDDRSSIQIIHSHSREAFISSPVKFNNDSQQEDHVTIQVLSSVRNYPIIISGYELSGQNIWHYLIKVNSNLCSNYSSVDVWQIEGNSFAISCENPYAITCFFDFFYSSKNIKLEEKEVQLGSYSQRLVVGYISDWSQSQYNSLIFQVDKRGNIIKVTEIVYRKKEQTQRNSEHL